ncbi:unnamed protein product [Meganyctiphanes norvegica]|uniref:Major facilitator superfamily (MFS) profile domain-containing protein n=1 Tax=Meganyctiphanes norvegica TaxID=48144 RepID=A0AAV2RR36_MEGNR
MEEEGLDHILINLGLGPWQLINFLAAVVALASDAPNVLSSTFTNAPVDFHCIQHDLPHNNTHRFDDSLSKCEVSAIRTNNSIENITSDEDLFPLQPCRKWHFDQSMYLATVTSEFNLVCDHAWLAPLFQLLYNAGTMTGDLFSGTISDRWGRRLALRAGATLCLTSTLIIGFAQNYSLILIARYFLGISSTIMIFPSINLVMETLQPKHRSAVGMLLDLPYSLAIMGMGGLAYMVREWRYLHFYSSVFAFILIPLAILLEESPRWLIQQGRLEEAQAVLERAAKLNRKPLPPKEQTKSIIKKIYQANQPLKKEEEGGCCKKFVDGITVFYRTPSMRLISIVAPLSWFLLGILYNGIPLNANNFTNNPFIYMALAGLMELGSVVSGVFIAERFNRVSVALVTFMVSGACVAAIVVVPEVTWWLKWVLVMAAMELISVTYCLEFIWAPELFPTVVRARGSSLCSFSSHAGCFVASFITEVLARWVPWIPNLLFGVAGLIAALLAKLLPETKDLPLCDTVQQVEDRALRLKGLDTTQLTSLCDNEDQNTVEYEESILKNRQNRSNNERESNVGDEEKVMIINEENIDIK